MASEGHLRIRAVAERTGVPAATLRAWERRYGVPAPPRSASAYRLYGEEDVAMVLRMRDLVASGLAPAEAARLVLEGPGERKSPPRHDTDPYETARERLVEATLRFDTSALELEFKRVLQLGGAVTIFERVLRPALVEIGSLWHAGELSIAQEHLFSNQAMGIVMDLLRLAQPETPTRKVIVACFDDEEHVLGALGASLRFATWGYGVVMLGARTPPEAIGAAVQRLQPDLVALSVTIAPSPERARELVRLYADACGATPWIVGGVAAEDIRHIVVPAGGSIAASEMLGVRRLIEKARSERRQTVESEVDSARDDDSNGETDADRGAGAEQRPPADELH